MVWLLFQVLLGSSQAQATRSTCMPFVSHTPTRVDPSAALDDLSGREGTFNMCSFWLVEALTRAGHTDLQRLEDARLMFEQVLGYANHLGLYSEQTGASGEALGNFPQAFTHLALISAAFNLDRALDQSHPGRRT